MKTSPPPPQTPLSATPPPPQQLIPSYSKALQPIPAGRSTSEVSEEADIAIPSSQGEFVEVSSTRRKKNRKTEKPGVKIGNGKTVNENIAPRNIAKLFVSLPVPGSSFPLRRITERIEQHLKETPFKVKKRLSTRGKTSPFEIYGDANLLESLLFDEDNWEARTVLQLTKTYVRLPKDYNQPDADSEKDVRARLEHLRKAARKAREDRGTPAGGRA